MVVDDSDDIRKMLRFVLDMRGYRVVEAANGREAVEAAQHNCPDVILMDLSMPVLDGYGAVKELRQSTKTRDAAVIAISAHDTVDHRNKALAVGFNDYLTKPIDFIHVADLIQRFVRKGGADEET
ncbi:MAG TPA: response regulator [Pyrinomonadaceae bacterium]|jgi:CheY-like chemotaxis protein